MAAPATSLNLAKIGVPIRIGIGAGAIILAALTYWVMFYTAVSQKIQQAKNQTTQLNTDLAAQKQAQASYFANRDELAMRQQRQRELNKVLPETTEQAAFLSAIQQVSNVSGIDLQAWQPMDERQEAFFAKVPMLLKMTGHFHQVAKFAYEIGKLDRIINVENIQLSAPRKEGDDVVLNAQCLATTFHMIAKGPKEMSRAVSLGALVAMGLVPFALAACGSEPVAHNADTGPVAKAAPVAAPTASTKVGPEYSESDFVENDRNRDPFRSFTTLFVEGQKRTFDAERKVLLRQYSLEDLKLVAIVQGADYPRAMVVDPKGKGSVLKRGDFVGRAETVHTGGTNGTDYQVNWRVDRVRDGDVVFIREDQAQPNIAPATRVVPLHPEATTNNDQDDDSKL